MDGLRQVHLPQVYFKAMWIFAVLLYILIPLQSGAISLIYKGIVFITFGCFFLLFFMRLGTPKTFIGSKEMICFILLFLTVMASLLLDSGALSFNTQIMGVLGFIEMPVAIMLVDSVDYNEKNVRFILYINIVIAVVFSLLSVSEYAYSGILDSLYLGYSNPNATAIYLLLNQAVLIMFLPMIKKFSLKILVIGLCAYEEYLVYLTDSRTCLIVSIAIMAYYLFGKKIKIPKWMVIAAMVFPMVFLYVYTELYTSNMLSDLLILGKELYSGREKIFINQMDILSWKNILGNAREYYFENMHNGALAIIASCGYLGYILWFLFYFWTIRRYRSTARTQLQFIALASILGVFIHSCSEAVLMVGGAHYSIIVATLFWILKGNPNEIKEEKYQ